MSGMAQTWQDDRAGSVKGGAKNPHPAGKKRPNARERGADRSSKFMREVAGGPDTKLAISLLAGLGLPFSDAPNAVYGLPDMYRLLLSACSREGGEFNMEAQYHRNRA